MANSLKLRYKRARQIILVKMSALNYDNPEGIVRKRIKTDWRIQREPKTPTLQKNWVKRVSEKAKQTSLQLPGLGENTWTQVVQYLSNFDAEAAGKTQADIVAALESVKNDKIEVYVYYKSMNVEQDAYDEPIGFFILKRFDDTNYAPTLEHISVNPYWRTYNNNEIFNTLVNIVLDRSRVLAPTAKFMVANVLNTMYNRTFFMQRSFKYLAAKHASILPLEKSKEKEPRVFISMIYLFPEPAVIGIVRDPGRALAEAKLSLHTEHSDWVAKTLEKLSLHNDSATCQSSRTCPKAGR